MVIVVSNIYFSLSEADGDKQRRIRLVPASARASKPGRHPLRKTVVCHSLFPTFFSDRIRQEQGWKLHMLKEMTSILFAVALFGVACHLANWGLQVIVAPFVHLLNGPLTGPSVAHSYIFHNRSKICR